MTDFSVWPQRHEKKKHLSLTLPESWGDQFSKDIATIRRFIAVNRPHAICQAVHHTAEQLRVAERLQKTYGWMPPEGDMLAALEDWTCDQCHRSLYPYGHKPSCPNNV